MRDFLEAMRVYLGLAPEDGAIRVRDDPEAVAAFRARRLALVAVVLLLAGLLVSVVLA